MIDNRIVELEAQVKVLRAGIMEIWMFVFICCLVLLCIQLYNVWTGGGKQ